jgi:single-stranded-DNA-specific exonuclease
VLEPRFHWRFAERTMIPPEVWSAATDLGVPEVVVHIMVARGLATPADIRSFAAADPRSGLHDARSLPDSEAVVRRLATARDRREVITVVGDFDADGLAGLAVLTRALRACGLTVGTYVPDRLDEGHGLSVRAIDAAEAVGAGLIITVDTGTSSLAEITEARRRGIDVIVTDHHRVGSELPEAIAVVNPHRPDARYPDPRLSGSGVALKVAQLAAAELLGMDPALAGARLADLALIGTVSDVAPILGENRAIARLGLERLRSQPRPGIAALLARAGIAAQAVDLETIGFAIAPRLNAAGRVGEARDAADLLLTEDQAEADRLAGVLEEANATRRDLLRDALAEARNQVSASPDDRLSMISGSWPVGIVGLVAGRLADETRRPAIVGADMGDTIRGSARGDGTIDLAAALDASSDLLLRHGGHRQAAGFEVRSTEWEELHARLADLAASKPPAGEATLDVDVALPAAAVDHRLLADLASLEPTGPGNQAALLAIEGLVVTRVRAASGGHAQLTVRRDRDVLDAVAFGRGDLVDGVRPDDRVDVIARLTSRAFAGLETLQLEIRDIASTGAHRASSALTAAIADRAALVST